MSESKNTEVTPGLVACAVCKQEIPASEAISPEAHDYFLHFCGGACHAAWKESQAAEVDQAFRERSGVKR
ncbi:DUF3330 domain-containing protein [Thiocystis violacea]|uniref:DUF3330 domain-containing protein n=1 Tax=Thiocystis violacea TaxID=13725 RepID=UPI001906C308|nr:DUF3330 domain-containing protein [Thiocystis violacea]MBK1724178.1 hypothetical protein [Thiocystis violacea]